MVDTGQNLFHIVATGSVDLVNDTAQVISSTGSAIAGIFSFAGGAPNFALFVINALIVSYLISQKCRQHQLQRKMWRQLDFLAQQQDTLPKPQISDKTEYELTPRTRTRTLTQ